jgi:hypothetical protein
VAGIDADLSVDAASSIVADAIRRPEIWTSEFTLSAAPK